VVQNKMHDFSFFRNNFLPVMNPEFHASFVFQIFQWVERAQRIKVRSSLVLSKIPFLLTPQWMCSSLCLPGRVNPVWIDFVHSKTLNGTLGILFLWPLVTASVNEWKLLRLIEKKGIVWREVSWAVSKARDLSTTFHD
jgi:hypothetical protein